MKMHVGHGTMQRSSLDRRHARRRRIGFLLANIYSGSANTVWPTMAREAERHNVVLFIFPGGRLNETAEHEYLRNHIFDLVHHGTVDGLVSWASAVCEHVSEDECRNFHARYGTLPIVTLNRKVGDLPLFGIDSYGGMLQLMEHLLDTHGYRKPAFIRGPDTHPQAAERYHAFTDSLAARDLACDPCLVSDPCSWDSGRKAALDFLDARELNPGRDFDVLVAASDILLFDAFRIFQSRGYRIPEDFAIAGFNDSEESRIPWPSFTTVRMPFEEQSVAAFRAVLSLVAGGSVESEVKLASRLVIRQSCGCRQDPRGLWAGEADREALIHRILELLSYDDEERVAWVEPLVASFFASRESGSADRFVGTLQRILMKVMQTGREIHPWQDVLSLLRCFCLKENRDRDGLLSDDLTNRSRILVSETLRRAYTFKHWHDGRVSRILGDFDKELLICRDRGSLSRVLSRHLPLLGISSAFLVTYESEEEGDIRYARLVGGFRTEGAGTDSPEELRETVFPASSLLPESLFDGLQPGSYIVQPLFIEEEPLGYLVIRSSAGEGFMYESIRSTLSSALKGILLFEEAGRARAVAERAQALKSRFLANVSSELQNPPLEIAEACRRLSALVGRKGDAEREAMTALIAQIDSLSRRQLGYAGDLMDLALTQVDDLPLRREIFQPRRLIEEAAAAYRDADGRVTVELDEPMRLPLVHWDRRQVGRILAVLLERAGRSAGGMSVKVRAELRIPFIDICIAFGRLPPETDGSPDDSPGSGESEIAMSLARNLALLHAGTLERETGDGDGRACYRLRLPLPNLEGSTLLTGGRETDTVLVLSSDGSLPAELDGYDPSFGCTLRPVKPSDLMHGAAVGEEMHALVWDMEKDDIAEWTAVQSIRFSDAFLRIPFLILAGDQDIPGASDLGKLLRMIPAPAGSGPIVLVDPSDLRRNEFASLLRTRCGMGDFIEVGAVDEITAHLESLDVGLFILNALSAHDVQFIRSIPRLATVPILAFVDRLKTAEEIEFCREAPKVVLCNRAVLEPAELGLLIDRLRRGETAHGPSTSALVKNALLFLNLHFNASFSRWKLADFVHVNEDYLTRIFHRELGLTPWDYLNRYRVRVAERLLRTTGNSIRAIASDTGFRDQAYFCRVFRAVTGRSPSEFRERTSTDSR